MFSKCALFIIRFVSVPDFYSGSVEQRHRMKLDESSQRVID